MWLLYCLRSWLPRLRKESGGMGAATVRNAPRKTKVPRFARNDRNLMRMTPR